MDIPSIGRIANLATVTVILLSGVRVGLLLGFFG